VSAMADNLTLSQNRRSPRPARPRDDAQIAEAIERQIRALGRRIAEDDPASLELLERLASALVDVTGDAVAGWRRSGFSDADIGAVLGVTKQAVAQRWPRTPR
jgi:hypothetical protein